MTSTGPLPPPGPAGPSGGRPAGGRHRAEDRDEDPDAGPAYAYPPETYPPETYPREAYPAGPSDAYAPGGPPPGDDPAEQPPGVPPEAGAPAASTGRAGRNLPAAVGVGLGLGAVVIASLFIWRPAFLVVVVAGVTIGSWEMARALGGATTARQARVPQVPLLVGAAAMPVLAYLAGPEGLVIGLLLTVAAIAVWRLADGPDGYGRDVVAGTLVAAYVPFLAGFGALLLHPSDGSWRILVTLAVVVLSDTGGYVAGVLFGKHPMAPRVSPKKSWEGFAGSVLTCALGGFLMLFFGFGRPWWTGVLFGVALSLVSVLGDLAESLLKRDLGIKDMGTLLPGHGGVMDRLDSIVFAVPVGFALLSVLAAPTA